MDRKMNMVGAGKLQPQTNYCTICNTMFSHYIKVPIYHFYLSFLLFLLKNIPTILKRKQIATDTNAQYTTTVKLTDIIKTYMDRQPERYYNDEEDGGR